VADFVLNFVAMVTGVGCCLICLTLFKSPTPKTPSMRNHLGNISYTS